MEMRTFTLYVNEKLSEYKLQAFLNEESSEIGQVNTKTDIKDCDNMFDSKYTSILLQTYKSAFRTMKNYTSI